MIGAPISNPPKQALQPAESSPSPRFARAAGTVKALLRISPFPCLPPTVQATLPLSPPPQLSIAFFPLTGQGQRAATGSRRIVSVEVGRARE